MRRELPTRGILAITLAFIVLVVALSVSCGAQLKTGQGPAADIANVAGKIEGTGHTLFTTVVQEHQLRPDVVTQPMVNNVALAVNKLGHAGLDLAKALRAYDAALKAGSDVVKEKAAVDKIMGAVTGFLTDIGKAIPVGTSQSIDTLIKVVIDAVQLVKSMTGTCCLVPA